MEQLSKEWFDARAGRITGSIVGAILDLSPYMTAEDVMRRMVRQYHKAPSEFEGNVATEYGSFHEAGARIEYEMETGNTVEPAGFYTYSDWLGASPDGFIENGKLIEIKCPYGQRDKNPPQFKSINDQPHYYAQIQIQLFVTDTSHCDFYQWSTHGTMLETVHYDQAWLDKNLPLLKWFYDQFLIEREKPNCQRYLEPKRQVIETLHAQKLIDEYDELTDAIDRASERKKDVMAELVKLANGQDGEICGRKLTMVERAGSVSYAKVVKEKLPELDLTPWTGKPSQYWKLT